MDDLAYRPIDNHNSEDYVPFCPWPVATPSEKKPVAAAHTQDTMESAQTTKEDGKTNKA